MAKKPSIEKVFMLDEEAEQLDADNFLKFDNYDLNTIDEI
jgi:hypothetical protein